VAVESVERRRSANATAPRSPEREELLATVERIAPLLGENARRAEDERTFPIESFEAMQLAGLYGLIAPRAVGGLEVDPITMFEVVEAVSYADSTAGWDLMIGMSGAELIGVHASDDAVAEVFRDGNVPFAASTVKAMGAKFARVDGGVRVTGRWPFGSGVRHAEWVLVMANDENEQGIAMIVPQSELTIHDNWFVAGLQGTGSCDYEAQDLFVPEHMTWDLPYVARRGGLRNRVPQLLLASLAAVTSGMALRSLDESISQAKSKMRPGSTTAVAGRLYYQHVLGETVIEVRAARALRLQAAAELWEKAANDEEITPQEWDYDNALNAYVAGVCARATTTAFRFGGSGAASLENVLQRNFRDCAVAAQHLQLSEQYFEPFGRSLLGLEGGDQPPAYSKFAEAQKS
jgi:alkylation response protein AidB-like acyl-CoA dehydrogenase